MEEEYSQECQIQFSEFHDCVILGRRDNDGEMLESVREEQLQSMHLFDQIYSRRKNMKLEHTPNPSLKSFLDEPRLTTAREKIEDERESFEEEVMDNLPVAPKKGIKSYTHPINKHVSYSKLNKNFKYFISSPFISMISMNVIEARQDPLRLRGDESYAREQDIKHC